MFTRLFRQIGWLALRLMGRARSDPVFGDIRFFRSKSLLPEEENSSLGSFQFWEAFRSIAHASPVVLIQLPSPSKNGPSMTQRDIYLELRTRYRDIFPEIIHSFSPLLSDLESKTGIKVTNPAKDLELEYLTIEHPTAYPDRLKKQDIEFSYRLSNSSLQFFVSVQDWQPVTTEVWDFKNADENLPATMIIGI